MGKLFMLNQKIKWLLTNHSLMKKTFPFLYWMQLLTIILFNFIESKIEGISFLSIDNARIFASSENTEEIVDADTNKKPSEVLLTF